MAHAYTPGLRVTERMRILKVRRLPLKGEVVVKQGETVTAETVVARTELPGNVQPVKAASILGVHQQDLRELMLKKEGDRVAKDEVIATNKSFFGLFKSHCKSPVDGTLESISDVTGQVIIREPPIPVEVDAYIDGLVAEVMPGDGVVIESEGSFLQGIFGVGGETVGPLTMAVREPGEELSEAHFKPEHKGKIVVGGSLIRIPALRRAIQVGVRAIVVGGLDDQDLRALLGYDLGVAITGQETIGCTVIVTEGFGKMTHGAADLRSPRLAARGRRPRSTARRRSVPGVMRPEIVIPLIGSSGHGGWRDGKRGADGRQPGPRDPDALLRPAGDRGRASAGAAASRERGEGSGSEGSVRVRGGGAPAPGERGDDRVLGGRPVAGVVSHRGN